MADHIRNIYRELQALPFDMRALLRLAIWGCAASAALMVAVLSAYSTMGSHRPAVAAASPAGQGTVERSAPQAPAVTAQLAARAADIESEARRLSEAVLALSADRDRLVARIASLERSLEDVTGSIKRQAAAAPPPNLLSPLPVIAVPAAPAAAPSARNQAPPQLDAATLPEPPVATRVANTPAAETADAEPGQARDGLFGVDVGGAVNFDGLRVLWTSAKGANAALFEGLHPIVAARESRTRGVDLRLIVGPLASTEAATRMCAALLAARRSCQMTIFEGQPLPLTAPAVSEPERRPTTAKRNSGQSNTRPIRP